MVSLEAALRQSRSTCEELRTLLAESRQEAEELRREAEAAKREAAAHEARARDAETGLEREAELVWGEAEAWVEHEEALDLREEFLLQQREAAPDDDDGRVTSHEMIAGVADTFDDERPSTPKRVALEAPPHIWTADTPCPAPPRATSPPSLAWSLRPSTSARETEYDEDDDDDEWALALFRARHPSKARLHQKLSSPKRRPPSPAETKRRHDERQLGAERNRGRLRSERSLRLQQAAEHAEHVRARSHEWRSACSANIALRHARAGANHAAYIASVRRRAVRETAKVDEVSFINELTSQEVQADLRRRLQEVEARIDEARTRRLDRLKGLQTKQKKRERAKQDQLSAQSLRRAEMAAERWDKLQERLAAVERRRADRLERVKERAEFLRVAMSAASTSQLLKTTQRRRDNDQRISPTQPDVGPLSPKRFNHHDLQHDSPSKHHSQQPVLADEKENTATKQGEDKDNNDDGRKRRARRSKKKRQSSSSSCGTASPNVIRGRRCEDETLEAATRIAVALRVDTSRDHHHSKNERSAKLASRLVVAAAEQCCKQHQSFEALANNEVATVLAWALQSWLSMHDARIGRDSENDIETTTVAAAACTIASVALDRGRQELRAAMISAAEALLDVVPAAAASPSSFRLAAASLGLIAALARKQDSDELCFGSATDQEEPAKHCAGAVVAALVAACLSDKTPATYLGCKWRVGLAGVDALNSIARLDRTRLDDVVFSKTSTRHQLLHLFDRLFAQALEHDDNPTVDSQHALKQACLDSLIELVGHFALHSQECLQWGSASRLTLLHRLVRLPFRYFSRRHHKNILFPTLIASCVGNDRNAAVLAEELSLRVLSDYLRPHLDRVSDEMEAPASAQQELHARLPRHLWPKAIEYFDRLCDAETLD